jgi:SMODS and SLOG-associating 2TM effector domain 2
MAPLETRSEVFTYVEMLGNEASSWYRTKKRPKQKWSISLRFLSLLFMLAGGLCPVVPPTSPLAGLHPYGYLLLAAGGGLHLFDRLFGISSAWMRYMVAAQEIDACLARFRIDWLRLSGTGVMPSGDKLDDRSLSEAMILEAAKVISQINEIVRRETDEWRTEFRTNLVHLSRLSIRDRPVDRNIDTGNSAERT